MKVGAEWLPVAEAEARAAKEHTAKGEFNDANLRRNAARAFQQALDGVRIPTREVMP